VRTIFYVDGLNLYKRCLEGRAGVKWLDLEALFEKSLPANNPIVRIRYFTALVDDDHDTGARARQRQYLAALGTIHGLTIHHGTMRTDRASMPAVLGSTAGPETEVWHTREKGSDVAMAAFLFHDLAAMGDRFDAAVLVTHDSDQAITIKLARKITDKAIGVLDPDATRAKHLHECASFYRPIKVRDVRASQLPEAVATRSGRTVTRPPGWV
jgi:Protein of unknown function DUF88.